VELTTTSWASDVDDSVKIAQRRSEILTLCERDYLRIKPRRRIERNKPQPLSIPAAINETFSIDFMHDQLSDGRSYRTLNAIDDVSSTFEHCGKWEDYRRITTPARLSARIAAMFRGW
jgi:hypothetical protein